MVFNIHEEIRKNKQRTIFIFILFFLYIGLIGGLTGIIFGGYTKGNLFDLQSIIFSISISLIIAIIYVLIFLNSGDKIILKGVGAKEVSREHYPFLYHTTEALSIAAGLKTPPKCYVIDDPALNAFATGFKPEKSYVVVTTGLLNKLNRQELEGVLAHEISHIKNRDIKVMLLAAGLVGATVFLADLLFRMFIFAPNHEGNNEKKDGKILIIVFVFWFILIIFSPIAAQLIKLAISRNREYLADSTAAQLTRYPEGLASALEKIKNDPNPLIKGANKATAHLFISSPFRKKSGLSNLFSTHPPIEERIKRLRGQI